MTPKRIAVKFFLSPDPTAAVELEPFIGLFHRFIQQQAVEGLLIDVADYAHVPEGPGVMLIGHDVDYGLDLNGGRAGLLTVGKRLEGGTLADHLAETVRKALVAMKAVEADPGVDVRFATDVVKIQLFDRLAAPNTDEAFVASKAELEGLGSRLFGDALQEVRRTDGEDSRRALAVELVASESVDFDTLLGRSSG